MKRFHIRNEIIKALKEKGLYIEAKDNEMQIPICSRSGDVVEQIMKPQWWVSCKPMAEEALKVCLKKVGQFLTVANQCRRAKDPTKGLCWRLDSMDGEHAGLVYLASIVVGSPMSRLPTQIRGRGCRRESRVAMQS